MCFPRDTHKTILLGLPSPNRRRELQARKLSSGKRPGPNVGVGLFKRQKQFRGRKKIPHVRDLGFVPFPRLLYLQTPEYSQVLKQIVKPEKIRERVNILSSQLIRRTFLPIFSLIIFFFLFNDYTPTDPKFNFL